MRISSAGWRAATVFGGLMCLSITACAAPSKESPLLGKWQADVAASSFQGRQPYRSGEMTFTAVDGNTVRVVSTVVTFNGMTFKFEYQGPEDDTVVSVKGNPYYDEASNVWTDARTLKRTERRKGEITGTTVMELAADGKTFTAKGERLTPDGVNYVTSIVWRKVE
jgi:hypothetical protein